ncbi:HTTM domain-containing protein [bacterium]|nr:HTTM domain-containing protein [bacterium]
MNKLFSDFFDEREHFNLSVSRICYYAYILYYHLILFNWIKYANYPEYYKPNGIFLLLDSAVATPAVLTNIWYVSFVFAIFSTIGFMSRISFIVVAVCFTILNGLPQIFQTLVGLNSANTLVMIAFCFTRAGDFLSVDGYLRKIFKKEMYSSFSSEYNWPIHVFRYLHILCVFFAGLCKLRDSGFEWALSNQLSYEIMCSHFTRGDTAGAEYVSPALVGQIVSWPWLIATAAFSTLVIELLSPLCLWSQRLRPWIIGALILMHLVSVFTVFISPVLFLGLYLFWFDWKSLYLKVKSFSDSVLVKQSKVNYK